MAQPRSVGPPGCAPATQSRGRSGGAVQQRCPVHRGPTRSPAHPPRKPGPMDVPAAYRQDPDAGPVAEHRRCFLCVLVSADRMHPLRRPGSGIVVRTHCAPSAGDFQKIGRGAFTMGSQSGRHGGRRRPGRYQRPQSPRDASTATQSVGTQTDDGLAAPETSPGRSKMFLGQRA